jgi:folylpolyglutamate synthase/dihydropteroate synthase
VELAALATEKGLTGEVFSTVADAVNAARNVLGANDSLLITGSFFIVGEALPLFESLSTKEEINS